MIRLHVFLIVLVMGFVWGEQETCFPCKYDAEDSGCLPNKLSAVTDFIRLQPSSAPQRREGTFSMAYSMGSSVRKFDIINIDSDKYHYIVSLQTLKCGNPALGAACYQHFCGGTMIAPNLILTAAHCFDKLRINNHFEELDGQWYYLPLRPIYAAISPQCRHLQNDKYGRFEVDTIFIHPDYIYDGVPLNDVAIVQIYGRNGQFYEGPVVEVVKEDTQENLRIAQFLGYGTTRPGDKGKYVVRSLHGGSNLLQYLTKEDFCRRIIDDTSNNFLNYTNMMCFYDPTIDACGGDSGGPLLVPNKMGIQFGMVSWGAADSCKQVHGRQMPGIYVRLTFFADWIQQMLCKYGKQNNNNINNNKCQSQQYIQTLAPINKQPSSNRRRSHLQGTHQECRKQLLNEVRSIVSDQGANSLPQLCINFDQVYQEILDKVMNASDLPESEVLKFVIYNDTVCQCLTIPDCSNKTAPLVQVYVLSDTTGSMRPYIEKVKSSVEVILEWLQRIYWNLEIAVGSYKDCDGSPWGCKHNYYWHELDFMPVGQNSTIINAIQGWQAHAGTEDTPEAQLYAIDLIGKNQKWSDDAAKLLIWFGDAPGKNIQGVNLDMAYDSITSKDIVVFAIDLKNLDKNGEATKIVGDKGWLIKGTADLDATLGKNGIGELQLTGFPPKVTQSIIKFVDCNSNNPLP